MKRFKILIHILTLLLFACSTAIPANSQSYSLGKQRVDRLKNATVKVMIQGRDGIGTGFFISETGSILTCFHVIQPALNLDDKSVIVSIQPIYVKLNNSDTLNVEIPPEYLTGKINEIAASNDFCLLVPVDKKNKKKYTFLPLGKFEDVSEGDEVYTAGHPLAINEQFISRGIFSTKYVDSTTNFLVLAGKLTPVKRNVGWLDLTINKGNSGGAVIRRGNKPEDDRVVGIVTNLLNKYGVSADPINQALNLGEWTLPNGVSLTGILKIFSEALSYQFNGIGGCVSINYFWSTLQPPAGGNTK